MVRINQRRHSGTGRDRLCAPTRPQPTGAGAGGTGLYRDGAALYKTQETAAPSLLLHTQDTALIT